ncbi:MAG: family 20 glycosylhydrolase, partial [Bacteroidota bacterium]
PLSKGPGSCFVITLYPLPKVAFAPFIPPARLSEAGSGMREMTARSCSLIGGASKQEPGPLLSGAIGKFGLWMQQERIDERDDGLQIIVECGAASNAKVPQLGVDESYQLEIGGRQAVITAATEFGAMHGLSTILQLVSRDGKEAYLPQLSIEDQPRFPWRGLMIDVSRHWIPKKIILQTIQGMGAVKMNVLHLHLSDDQGFRVESKRFPKLHEQGSDGMYFTQEDIKEIVQYAAEHGIRVVPEFDVPGHTQSWLVGYPEYAAAKGPFALRREGSDLFSVPMDPTNEALFPFLDELFAEMIALFPDQYFHIGGDEVNPTHWEANEEIQTFMKKEGLESPEELQAYFNRRLYKIVQDHGKKMLGWDEILHPDLAEGVAIQAWRSHKALFEAVQAGSEGILSMGLYLDHKLPAGKHYQVDPLVVPGAVNIEPDSSHWRMYDIVMEVPQGAMEGQLVLFDRNPENVSGFFSFLDRLNGFSEAKINDAGELEANILADIGELSFTAKLEGDALDGKMAFGFLSMEANGEKVGGHDLPGTHYPEIEIVEPLNKEEEARIIGGEACMWTEVAGATNIQTRIWPRTAAIAEKLWSPQSLTQDVDDMYRRLQEMDDYLAKRGAGHQLAQQKLIDSLSDKEGRKALKTLLSVLEEVKYYNRLGLYLNEGAVHWPDLALDKVVDAALPESFMAREFNQLVDTYLASPTIANKTLITSRLNIWALNHEVLSLLIQRSPKVQEIENLSRELAIVSQLLQRHLEKVEPLTETEKAQLEEKLQFLETGENGVMVAVVPGLGALLGGV